MPVPVPTYDDVAIAGIVQGLESDHVLALRVLLKRRRDAGILDLEERRKVSAEAAIDETSLAIAMTNLADRRAGSIGKLRVARTVRSISVVAPRLCDKTTGGHVYLTALGARCAAHLERVVKAAA